MIDFKVINEGILPALTGVLVMLILFIIISAICVAVNCTVNYLKYKDSVDKVFDEHNKREKDKEMQQLKDSIVKELKRGKRK